MRKKSDERFWFISISDINRRRNVMPSVESIKNLCSYFVLFSSFCVSVSLCRLLAVVWIFVYYIGSMRCQPIEAIMPSTSRFLLSIASNNQQWFAVILLLCFLFFRSSDLVWLDSCRRRCRYCTQNSRFPVKLCQKHTDTHTAIWQSKNVSSSTISKQQLSAQQ